MELRVLQILVKFNGWLSTGRKLNDCNRSRARAACDTGSPRCKLNEHTLIITIFY